MSRRVVAVLVATLLVAHSLPSTAQDAGVPDSGTDDSDSGASFVADTDAAAAGGSATGPDAAGAQPWATTEAPAPARSAATLAPTVAPEPARDMNAVFIWGTVALEVLIAAAIVMRIGIDPDSEILPEALVLSAPLPLAVPIAILAYLGQWDDRPALAIHGGGWTGAIMGLTGALLDGARLDRGTTAEVDALFFVLGAAGVFLGAAFGATQLDDDTEKMVWIIAPTVAIGLELAIAIVWAIVTFGGGSATEGERFLGWSTATVGLAAVGFSHAFAL